MHTGGGCLTMEELGFGVFSLANLVSVFMPMFHVNHSPCFFKTFRTGR